MPRSLTSSPPPVILRDHPMNTTNKAESTEQHIMVVDDDRYLLMAIGQTLTLNGYSVTYLHLAARGPRRSQRR